MSLWYRKYGFYSNPLSIKPAAFHADVFGNDGVTKRVLDKIHAGEIFFVEGAYGNGKTTILKSIIREFGGRRKVIYYPCNSTEYMIEVDKLLKDGQGILKRLFGGAPKDMILLLDEAQDLTDIDSEALKEEYDKKSFKSIVLVGSNFNSVRFKNGLKTLIGNNIIKLNAMSDDEAVGLIRKRIGNMQLLSDDIIREVYQKSGMNPRKLLKNCEDICRYAVDNAQDKVTGEHVEKILG
jgi:hypothetical protein